MGGLIRCTPIVLGIPYEEGAYFRKGMKEGPAFIRQNFDKLRPYSLRAGAEIPYKLNQIDGGDVIVRQFDPEGTRASIKSRVSQALRCSRAPVVLGGDHSISLAVLRALSSTCAFNFGILHFDAHSDTFQEVDGYEFHHGTVFRRAIEEGLVQSENVFQIGLRGLVRSGGMDWAKKSGVNVIPVWEAKKAKLSLKALGVNNSLPMYVSFDIDVVDPAFAPGTGTPVPGGFSSSEALGFVSQLGEYQLIGFDLVEVAPTYDVSGITSLLAAHILFEVLTVGSFFSPEIEGV